MKKLFTAAAGAVACMVVAAVAYAAAPNSSFVRGRADFGAAQHTNLAKPLYAVPVNDPDFGTKITRIGGNHGEVIPGYGASADSVWGRDARHHTNHAMIWNSDESVMWLQNGDDSDESGYGPPTVIRKLFLDGQSYVPLWAKSHHKVFTDSVSEMRFHPLWPNIAYVVVSDSDAPSGKTMVLMWDHHRNKVLKRMIIPVDNATLQGVGGVSDNGRFMMLCTDHRSSTLANTVVIIDWYGALGAFEGVDSVGAVNEAGGGSFDTTVVAASTVTSSTGQSVSHLMISTKGTYGILKFNDEPQHIRVFHRGTSAGDASAIDTTTLKLRPHTMHAGSLRTGNARDYTDGWIYPLSHASMNEDSLGNEVIVGGGRSHNGGSPQSQWSGESTAAADSGTVIMVDLSNGWHYHVSAGRKFTSGVQEPTFSHSSGNATNLRGWVVVSYKMSCGQTRRFEDEVVWWKLSRNTIGSPFRSGWRMGQARTDPDASSSCTITCPRGCETPDEDCYRQERHVAPSPSGTRVAVPSNWRLWAAGSQGDCNEAKTYVLDARAVDPLEYWISPSGSDLSCGCSPNTPWKTVEKANATVSASDANVVVRLASNGTGYTAFPNPANAAANGKRYYFYGNVANPGAVVFAGSQTTNAANTSVRGFRVSGTLSVVPKSDGSGAHRDTIGDAIIDQGLTVGTNYSVFTRLRANGRFVHLGTVATGGRRRFVSDTLSYSTLTLTMNEGAPAHAFQTGAASATAGSRLHVDSLLVERNAITITVPGMAAAFNYSPRRHFQTRYSTYRYNTWTIDNQHNGEGETWIALAQSDSSIGNLHNVERSIAHGFGQNSLLFSHDGVTSGTVASTTVDSCYLSVRNGTPIWFQDGMKASTIAYTTAVSSNWRALKVDREIDGGIIDHNTLIGAPAGTAAQGTANLEATFAGDTSKVTNNIIGTFHSRVDFPLDAPNSDPGGTTFGGLYLLAGSGFDEKLFANWNLYATWPFYENHGDASIIWCCPYDNARPDGTAAYGGPTFRALFPTTSRIRGDSLSVYGSPQFDHGGDDSLFVFEDGPADSLFDPAIGVRSAARGKGKDGTDIGAVAFVSVSKIGLSRHSANLWGNQVGTEYSKVITIGNSGTATLNLSGLATDTAGLEAAFGSATVAAGASTTLTVSYTPATLATKLMRVTFNTDDPTRPAVSVVATFERGGGSTGGPQTLPTEE